MAKSKFKIYRGLTKEQARTVISEERQKDEPNGELIDFCKRRINYINRLEKKGIVRKKEYIRTGKETITVFTETDKVIVVKHGGEITKQFEWHISDEKLCKYTVKEHGEVVDEKIFQMSKQDLKKWTEEYKRYNRII